MIHPWRFNMASHENQVLLEIPGETNRNWVGLPSWLQLPVVQRWGCFPAQKIDHHRCEVRSCFSKPMLGGRSHVPPQLPRVEKTFPPPSFSTAWNSYSYRGWGMATRSPPVNSPVGGELVVEIYHDIYRVSKTSIKRWLLRISERSTVWIFDDAFLVLDWKK